MGFADERRGYTHAFERYALELSRHMTIKDVAAHLGVGWDAVKDMQKRNLQRRFAKHLYPITTAALEGTKNKIKTLQRQAYGFRDHEFFKLKIYALHETRYALVG